MTFVVFVCCSCSAKQSATPDMRAKLSFDACVGHPAFSSQGKSAVCESRRPAFPKLIVQDTPEVRHFISYFKSTRRRFMEESLSRGEDHWADMSEVMNAFGLSERLISVALVESGFKPEARSRRGAVGMWQIMPRTARYLGLTVNIFVDQRKDPRKSTAAAARYLAELYTRFDDWYLALAAYNAGPTRVSKAIRQSNSRDFFEIARKGYLKKETAQFVPKVLAAVLITSNPQRFGFGAQQPLNREVVTLESNSESEELASVSANRNRL
jgi:membrane-bound lytic murein transglycosylase D